MDIKNEILWRIYAVMLALLVFAIIIFVKTAKIQIVEGPEWRKKRDAIHIDMRPVQGERGSILAYDGSVLASSLPYYEIRMDTRPPAMTDKLFEENVDSLAALLMPWVKNQYGTKEDFAAGLRAARERNQRYFFIARGITYPELEKIKTFPLFNLGNYRGGFIVNRQSKRSKPYKMLAHRTIGYVRDGNPKIKIGLEGSFDHVLSGDSEDRLMQRISGGYWIPLNDISEVQPKKGDDIVTTIDVDIQDIVGNALLKALKLHDAGDGCAIVMDVKTGAIRAIANIGKTTENEYFETYNYAIGTRTEPGSTFKLATMMALLEDEAIGLDDTIPLFKGEHSFYNEKMKDASKHSLNFATVRQAFEMSSNVGLAQVAFNFYEKKGKRDNFTKRLRQFHLTDSIGIELDGEPQPLIKDPKTNGKMWSGTTIPWMAIGYELELTPLQLLNLYSAVANGGTMMKPYIVSEIRSFGETVRRYEPTVLDEQIAKPETIAKVQELLRGVVKNGTAVNIYSPTYQIAGKTGTAQTNYYKLGQGEKLKYQSSFAGYFPADNPQYACIVVIRDPKSGDFYGSKVAAPVFREIADKCYVKRIEAHQALNKQPKLEFSHRELPIFSIGYADDFRVALNHLGLEYNQNEKTTKWVVMDIDSSAMVLKSRRNIPEGVVPDVIGMGLRDAIYRLEMQGLRVTGVEGKGKVVWQSLKSGQRASKGTQVKLRLR